MVPRYVRIKKLPAKHKQPHVSEGLRVGRGTAGGGGWGSSSKRQQGAACGWQTHSGVREAAKQGPRSRKRPRCGKAHGSLRPWAELGQAQASASVERLVSEQPGPQRLLGCQPCPGNRKLAPAGPGKEATG